MICLDSNITFILINVFVILWDNISFLSIDLRSIVNVSSSLFLSSIAFLKLSNTDGFMKF